MMAKSNSIKHALTCAAVPSCRPSWVRLALRLLVCAVLLPVLIGCQKTTAESPTGLRVLAVETFLADIAQNVAGDRVSVSAILPIGLDPHGFEPTPQDAVRIAACDILIENGAGMEEWLPNLLTTVGGDRRVIEAASGLPGRHASSSESPIDPHFWLDPIQVIGYVANIRDGFIAADPDGKDIYTANASAYTDKLRTLDGWIRTQVDTLPIEQRVLVTNHDSLGYFADRYGFRIIGTLLPGTTSEAEPSAQQLARLVDEMRLSGVKAIFVDVGSNQQLADQIARETGARVVASLYIHSISLPDGDAPSYLAMMRRNVEQIVAALR